jgi:hypothetical protein
MTEKAFQAMVVKLARLCGWTCYHTFDSRRSEPGFVDLVMVRGADLLFVECKSERGRLRPAQEKWRDLLLAAGQDWRCWRPSMWGEIEERLRRE